MTKPAIQSKGVQGSVGAIAVSLIALVQAFQADPPDPELIASLIGGVIAGSWALYGRYQAGGIAGILSGPQ